MLIREKDRLALCAYFDSIIIPFEVWAYGSRVNGSAHEGSDLDLVIRANDLQPFPVNEYNQLVEIIRESNIPILVEIRDWTRLPESFHKQIEKQYEVFYSNIASSQDE